MAKTILFNIPATGHVNPSLAVVRELISRGETVLYANSDEFQAQIEATGASFVAYPDVRNLKYLVNESAGQGNIPRNMRDLIRISEVLTPFALDLIEREKPDYVIFDSLARWGKLATDKREVKSLGICVTFIIGEGVRPPFTLPMILDTLGKMIRVLPSYIVDAVRMTVQQGIYPGFLVDAVMSTGEMTIVFTSPEFQPNADKFPDHYKFVGTSISDRPQDSDFPYGQLSGVPVVYISLGTMTSNREFYGRCFQAFGDFEAQFILSAGKSTNLNEFENVPDNFILRNYVPQLEILKRADAFVTHGGLNSVHESLVHGVPMIVVPQQIEQGVVGLQVQKHRVGITPEMAPPFDVSVEQLRESLKTILADGSYAENAKRMGETLIRAGGYQRAVDEIFRFTGR